MVCAGNRVAAVRLVFTMTRGSTAGRDTAE